MRVLVCGDRNWWDRATMLKHLMAIAKEQSQYKGIVVLIEGEARGADQMSADIVSTELRDFGWRIEKFPANWTKYGKAAGPMRNEDMLNAEPDLVLAFHNDIKNSKGTAHMVKIARAKGIPVEVIG
jgi:YspA, cpYpsA-related SLOG family